MFKGVLILFEQRVQLFYNCYTILFVVLNLYTYQVQELSNALVLVKCSSKITRHPNLLHAVDYN